jgi:PAS domain-containing protein
MAVKEDITDFMEADAARRRIAAGFTAVFAALPFAILLVDTQGRALIANQAAETLFGTEVPRGTRFDELNLLWADANGAALPVAEHPLMRVLAGMADTEGIQTRIGVAPPTGGTRWLRCSARPVSMPETHEVAALLVLTEESGAC